MSKKPVGFTQGVSTPVGSSRIRIRAPRRSAFRISTRCCNPTGRVADHRVRIDLQPVILFEAQEFRAHLGLATLFQQERRPRSRA